MMQSTPALYVRCRSRRYEPAQPDQVLEAAQSIVDARMQRGLSFKDPDVACTFFREKLGAREREVFVAAMLDTRHRLIEYVELFLGTVDGAEVHPREVVKQALRHNAAAARTKGAATMAHQIGSWGASHRIGKNRRTS